MCVGVGPMPSIFYIYYTYIIEGIGRTKWTSTTITELNLYMCNVYVGHNIVFMYRT